METNPFACASVGALSFALIGFAFGGLAGWIARRSGQAPGGVIGRAVAEALDLPAAFGPAVDGAAFLSAVGFAVGLAGGWHVLLYTGAGLVALAVSAAVLGGFAHRLIQRRPGIL